MLQGLSIIIVNYKSASLVKDCIESFIHEISVPASEIIVVDNNSNDGSESILKSRFPDIQYVQMGYNAGFARANNKGIRLARFSQVLLLNADTIIENNAITNCYESLLQSRYVAAGIQLLNADRSYQISGSYVMKGGLNYLLILPFTGELLGYLAKAAKVKKPSVAIANENMEIDWINGAFLMVKSDAVEKAGLLDEDFFLYMEEIEWCSRLRKQGRLCLFGNIRSVHLQGETTKEHYQKEDKGYGNLFDKMGQQLMLSIWVRQRKEFGSGWFLFLLLAYALEIPIFGILLGGSKLLAYKKYSFTNFRGYTKNYWRNLAYTRNIISNKPFFYKAI